MCNLGQIWRIIAVLTQNHTILMFMDITDIPPNLAEMCRNTGFCCGFRAAAAREKYPGFILIHSNVG